MRRKHLPKLAISSMRAGEVTAQQRYPCGGGQERSQLLTGERPKNTKKHKKINITLHKYIHMEGCTTVACKLFVGSVRMVCGL